MKDILIIENGCIRMESIECEEDLVLGPGIYINPPPEMWRCDCCGRHMSELKPFGEAGDPLLGDFDGALLVKTSREDNPYDEETLKALTEASECYKKDGYKDILDWMVDKYGKEEAEKFYAAEKHGISIWDSWECRDCIVLDDDEYLERLYPAQNEPAQALSES